MESDQSHAKEYPNMEAKGAENDNYRLYVQLESIHNVVTKSYQIMAYSRNEIPEEFSKAMEDVLEENVRTYEETRHQAIRSGKRRKPTQSSCL